MISLNDLGSNRTMGVGDTLGWAVGEMERVGLTGSQRVWIITEGRVALKERRGTVNSVRSLLLEYKVPRKESTGQQRVKTAIWELLAQGSGEAKRIRTGEPTL